MHGASRRSNELFLEGEPASLPECWCRRRERRDRAAAWTRTGGGRRDDERRCPRGHHVESLDVFRGATVAAMILVNNPATGARSSRRCCTPPGTGDVRRRRISLLRLHHGLRDAVRVRAAADVRPGRGRRTSVSRAVRPRWSRSGLRSMRPRRCRTCSMRIPGVLQRLGSRTSVPRSSSALGAVRAGRRLHCAADRSLGRPDTRAVRGQAFHPDDAHSQSGGFVDARVFGSHTLMPGFDPEGLLARAHGGDGARRCSRRTVAAAPRGSPRAGSSGSPAAARRRSPSGWRGPACGRSTSRSGPAPTPSVVRARGRHARVFAYVVECSGVRRWARPFLWLGVEPARDLLLLGARRASHRTALLRSAFGTTAEGLVVLARLRTYLESAPARAASLLFAIGCVMLAGRSGRAHWPNIGFARGTGV